MKKQKFMDTLSSSMEIMSPNKKIKSNSVGTEMMEFNHVLGKFKHHHSIKPDEMQAFAMKAWHIHSAYDQRMRQIEQEKKFLERSLKTMWTGIERILYPVLQVDHQLLPVYKELVDIHIILDELKNAQSFFANPEFRNASLLLLQEKLHKLESQKVNGVFMPPNVTSIQNQQIPTGQALCVSLMNRCFNMIHYLQTLPDEYPTEPPSKLQELNSSLVSILGCLKAGYDFDPMVLKLLKEQLTQIQNQRKDGVFYELDGTRAVDQIRIQKEFDLAQDLLYECLVHSPEQDFMTREMENRVYEARQQLWDQLEYSDESNDMSMLVYHTLMDPVTNAVDYCENLVSSASHKLFSLIQSSLGTASRLLHSMEPVEDSLVPLYDQMKELVADLKQLRHEKVSGQDINEKLSDCKKIYTVIQKRFVNDKFVNEHGIQGKGQEALKAVYDQIAVLLKSL